MVSTEIHFQSCWISYWKTILTSWKKLVKTAGKENFFFNWIISACLSCIFNRIFLHHRTSSLLQKNLLQCSFSTTKKIIFFFSVPPVISSLHPSSNLTVRKGSTVKLSCNASGFPIPGISWQREVSSTLHKITKSIAPALLVLSSSQTKEQKDPKTMSDGTDVRSKSGELSLLQWTFIDQLERGQTWAKKNLRDFSYVIWNLWKKSR